MSFVAGFYSFIIELSDQDRGIFETLKVKLARHPEESEIFLLARLVAYLHCYTSGLQFTEGLFQPDLPTLERRNELGDLAQCVYVGPLQRDKLQAGIRHHRGCQHVCYFLTEEEIHHFAHGLRGSTTNWIASVPFWRIPIPPLESLGNTLKSSNRWLVSIVDEQWYVSAADVETSFALEPINMWDQYQKTLTDTAEKL